MGSKKSSDCYDGIPDEIIDYLAFVMDEYANLRELCIVSNKTAEENEDEIKWTRKLAKRLKKRKPVEIDTDFLFNEYYAELEKGMRSSAKFNEQYGYHGLHR